MQNEWGDTALMGACGEGHVTIAALLISKGAVVNLHNKVKSTMVKMYSGCMYTLEIGMVVTKCTSFSFQQLQL